MHDGKGFGKKYNHENGIDVCVVYAGTDLIGKR